MWRSFCEALEEADNTVRSLKMISLISLSSNHFAIVQQLMVVSLHNFFQVFASTTHTRLVDIKLISASNLVITQQHNILYTRFQTDSRNIFSGLSLIIEAALNSLSLSLRMLLDEWADTKATHFIYNENWDAIKRKIWNARNGKKASLVWFEE